MESSQIVTGGCLYKTPDCRVNTIFVIHENLFNGNLYADAEHENRCNLLFAGFIRAV